MRAWVADDALETGAGARRPAVDPRGRRQPVVPDRGRAAHARAAARGARRGGRGRAALAPRHHRRRACEPLTAEGAGRAPRTRKGRARCAALRDVPRRGSSRRPASGRGRCASAASRRGGPARPRRPRGVALAADARPGPVRELVLAAVGAAAADGARVAVRLAGGDPLRVARTPGVRPARLSRRSARTLPDALAELPVRAHAAPRSDQRSLRRSRTLRTLPSVALGDQPVRAGS